MIIEKYKAFLSSLLYEGVSHKWSAYKTCHPFEIRDYGNARDFIYYWTKYKMLGKKAVDSSKQIMP